ncbi:transient receptor potential channel pyrexia-like [Ischnura elegans]|uniref:transient receptor potential channel pyrexia-like n=1 Tax=Ischnura elegans TaxID=197161 RepID=UPI001ED8A4CD|nr:transient receptor potential channel pyrexia-like [Ischnura elegans]
MGDITDDAAFISTSLQNLINKSEEHKLRETPEVQNTFMLYDDDDDSDDLTFDGPTLNFTSKEKENINEIELPQIIVNPASPRSSIDLLENAIYTQASTNHINSQDLEQTSTEESNVVHPDTNLHQPQDQEQIMRSQTPDSTKEKPKVHAAKVKNDPRLNKALMKAVSINSIEDVETALMCGAYVMAQSPPFFISPLHFAAWLGNHSILEYLIAAGSLPNIRDIYGRTPLHLAAAMGHKECVYFLLEAGAQPNVFTKEIQTNDLLPRGIACSVISSAHALTKGKKYEFDPFLDGFQMPSLDCGCRTPLHEAVKGNHPECVSFLLAAGGDPSYIDSLGLEPLLLAGSGVNQLDLNAISSYEEVVSCLLGNGANAKACDPGTGTSALHNAVTLGSLSSVILLLSSKADPGWNSPAGGNSTALHEAAGNGNAAIVRLILESEMDLERRTMLTNQVDSIGRTPLHRAANVGSRCCISLLLDNGANLGLRNKAGVTAMEALLHHVPRPKRFLFDILESRIHCNSASPEELGFMLYLDFRIMAPDGFDKQTTVLNSIINAKDVPKDLIRSILGHPMVETYVRLKWNRLRKYYLAVVSAYFVFVISLSTYITLEYLYPYGSEFRSNDLHRFILVVRYMHLAFALVVLLNVLGQCYMNIKYYSKQFETWTNGVSAILSNAWILAGEFDGVPSVGASDWVKHCVSIAIPLSWIGLMLQLGRFPLLGSHALLFEAVLRNVLWTFCVLGCIVLGFSFSFFVQFHETQKASFGNPWRSFVKTMVMMTGEFEYTTLFNNELGNDEEEKLLKGTSRISFLIFVVVASIVLVNLIVGLAVSDTQELRSEGRARGLHKRAEFVDLLECMVSPIARRQAIETRQAFSPNGVPKEKNSALARDLPRRLLDSMIDIATARRDSKQNINQRLGKVDSWTSLSPTNNISKSMESTILNMLENFLREVTTVLATDNMGNATPSHSPHLSTLGQQVLRSRRAMRGLSSNSVASLAPPVWVPKPSSLRI